MAKESEKKTSKKTGAGKITKDMTIQQIVVEHPEVVDVFFKYGMHCLGCAAARFENLEQGAMAHGIDVDAMIKDMNKALEKKGKDSDKSDD